MFHWIILQLVNKYNSRDEIPLLVFFFINFLSLRVIPLFGIAFPPMEIAFETMTRPFEMMERLFEMMTRPFETMESLFETVTRAFETMERLFETVTRALRIEETSKEIATTPFPRVECIVVVTEILFLTAKFILDNILI